MAAVTKRGARKPGRRRASVKPEFSAWDAIDNKTVEEQRAAMSSEWSFLGQETSPLRKLREEVEMLHLQRTKRQLEAEISGGVGGFQCVGGGMSPSPPPPKSSHTVQLECLQQQINVLHDLREELAKNVELAHLKVNALEDKVG